MTIVGPIVSDKDAEPFLEVDPTGRYGRYADILGMGAVKVYRGFDQEEGIEVAWNQIGLCSLEGDAQIRDRLLSEIQLLQSLRHENVIALYHAWIDAENSRLNFITEICTSGNLRQYKQFHRNVSLKAIKKWSRQILHGLAYLHLRKPFMIHRDISCSNLYINGNVGQVKIGDLGMAAIVEEHCRLGNSMTGKSEYVAPEVHEDYTQKVDIYSFGMSVLEMLTMEIPYKEYDNKAKIYKKVMARELPATLDKIKDPVSRAFIERCLGTPENWPSAVELLRDPFFSNLDNDDS